MALVLGLTGGIGVGKSTVAELLGERGARIVDVDGLGREVLEPGGGAYEPVIEAFGSEILAPDSRIDRIALAEVVFGAANRLGELEAISHPAINEVLASLVDHASNDLIVLDMAVLTESHLGWCDGERLYRRVVVVEAPWSVRLPRLVSRGMSEDDARSRMEAQATDLQRRALADVIVTNDGDLAELAHDVDRLWPTIEAWMLQSVHAQDAGST